MCAAPWAIDRTRMVELAKIVLHAHVVVEEQHAPMLHLGQQRQVKTEQVQRVRVLRIGVGRGVAE
jgi:hypothetical protein